MRYQLKYYLISTLIVAIAAAPAAVADPMTVELAERTALADPDGLIPPTTTTTTSTTTTTLPTIPSCPNGLAFATPGSQSGYNYWMFSSQNLCQLEYGSTLIYCFENPQVQQAAPQQADWEMVTREIAGAAYRDPGWFYPGSSDWAVFAAEVTGTGANHTEACYICGCYRSEGCFPPGVKITMADGSLRNIEDVRAGDLVRNAKTGAAVKVRKVIEGPETLPLIRFGFDNTAVTTSQAHPVLTAAGLKPANQLKKGDTIFDSQQNPHTLTILESLPVEEGQRVINVDLEVTSSDTDKRLLVSDGIITGDIVLQGLLKERK